MKVLPILALSLGLALPAFSQTDKAVDNKKVKAKRTRHIRGYVGPGLGLDYGGIGVKVEYLPVRSLGIFAGGGLNFAGLGYNAGATYKFFAEKDVRPVVTAMYGYNAVVKLQNFMGNEIGSQTYYGFTVGGGGEFDVGKGRVNKISLLLLIPFRSDEFRRDTEGMSVNILPFAISAGINIAF